METLEDRCVLSGNSPVAVPDVYAMDEDTVLTVNAPGFLGNDYDPEGDPFHFYGGQFQIGYVDIQWNTDGSFTYTPPANWHGEITFWYMIEDSNYNRSDLSPVTITVHPVNDAPTVNMGFGSLAQFNEGDTFGGLIPYWEDVDQDTVTFSATGLPDGIGINAQNGNIYGTLSYTSSGTYSVTVTATDPSGASGNDAFTLVVQNTNRAPVAEPDIITTEEDTALIFSVLDNDYDPDGDPLTVTLESGPASGFILALGNGQFHYTPFSNANGSDSLIYTVSDGNGFAIAATVNITVNPVNDSPTFSANNPPPVDEDSGSVTVWAWATFDPGASDEYGQQASYTVQNISNSTLFSVLPEVSSDGHLTYTLAPNANGSSTIEVLVSDGSLNSSPQAFTILVTPVNDLLVAPENQISSSGDSVTLTGIASGTGSSSTNYSATGLPPGLTIDSISGTISGEIPNAFSSGGYYSVIVTATDSSANVTDSCTFMWGVDTYPAYLFVVSQADQVYSSAVNAAADARLLAIANARVTAVAAAGPLYSNYIAQVLAANDQYFALQATIDTAYQSALQAANSARQPYYDQAMQNHSLSLATALQDYNDAVQNAEVNYQLELDFADTTYASTMAPYQADLDDAIAVLQSNPEDPVAQANFVQAQAAFIEANALATSVRATAYSAAEADFEANLVMAEEDYGIEQNAADDAFDTAMIAPDEDWDLAEQTAWSDWLLANSTAIAERDVAEGSAWNHYVNSIDELTSDLAATEAFIQSQFEMEVGMALSSWQITEESAWISYAGNQAAIPNAPPLQPRILAPIAVPVAPVDPFPGFALLERMQEPQPVKPFGGALALRNGKLVMPNLHEVEEDGKTILKRLRALLVNIGDRARIAGINFRSIITGDIFDKNEFQYFDNLQANQNKILITINGIWTTRQNALAILNSVATYGDIPRWAVVNETHGFGDLEQVMLNQLGRATIADLRAATQIELAAIALRNNGGQGPKTIYVVAHSQGTEIFYRALNFLSNETKAMIDFVGVGGERFVPNDIGLRSARNYYFSDDLVPRTANATPLRRLFAIEHKFEVHRMPAAPILGSGHNWLNNYATLFSTPNQITVPQGTRVIQFGDDLILPFWDLRLNRN